MPMQPREAAIVARAVICLAAADGRLTRHEIDAVVRVLKDVGLPSEALAEATIIAYAKTAYSAGGRATALGIRAELGRHTGSDLPDAIRRACVLLAETIPQLAKPAATLLELLGLTQPHGHAVTLPRSSKSLFVTVAVASTAVLVLVVAAIVARLGHSDTDTTPEQLSDKTQNDTPSTTGRKIVPPEIRDAASPSLPHDNDLGDPSPIAKADASSKNSSAGAQSKDTTNDEDSDYVASDTSLQNSAVPIISATTDFAKPLGRVEAEPDVRNIRWLQSSAQVQAGERQVLVASDVGCGRTLLSGTEALAGKSCELCYEFIDDKLVGLKYEFSKSDSFWELHRLLTMKHGKNDDPEQVMEEEVRDAIDKPDPNGRVPTAEEKTQYENFVRGLIATARIHSSKFRWTASRHRVWLTERPACVIQYEACSREAQQLRMHSEQLRRDAEQKDRDIKDEQSRPELRKL